MDLLDTITIALSILACWGFAGIRIRKEAGTSPERSRSWLLLGVAIGLRLLLGEGTFLFDVAAILRDLGIGLMVGSVRLYSKGLKSRRWLVSGLLLCASFFTWETVWNLTAKQEILVELGPDDRIEEVTSILERYDADWQRAFPNVTLEEDEDLAQYYLVSCPAEEVDALMDELRADRENVDYVEYNHAMGLVPTLEGDR